MNLREEMRAWYEYERIKDKEETLKDLSEIEYKINQHEYNKTLLTNKRNPDHNKINEEYSEILHFRHYEIDRLSLVLTPKEMYEFILNIKNGFIEGNPYYSHLKDLETKRSILERKEKNEEVNKTNSHILEYTQKFMLDKQGLSSLPHRQFQELLREKDFLLKTNSRFKDILFINQQIESLTKEFLPEKVDELNLTDQLNYDEFCSPNLYELESNKRVKIFATEEVDNLYEINRLNRIYGKGVEILKLYSEEGFDNSLFEETLAKLNELEKKFLSPIETESLYSNNKDYSSNEVDTNSSIELNNN